MRQKLELIVEISINVREIKNSEEITNLENSLYKEGNGIGIPSVERKMTTALLSTNGVIRYCRTKSIQQKL